MPHPFEMSGVTLLMFAFPLVGHLMSAGDLAPFPGEHLSCEFAAMAVC